MRPTSPTPVDRQFDRPASWVVLFIALLLLCYTVVRSAIVSFTIDETGTFIHNVTKGVLYQRTFDQMNANYHLLNVWWTWCSCVHGH